MSASSMAEGVPGGHFKAEPIAVAKVALQAVATGLEEVYPDPVS